MENNTLTLKETELVREIRNCLMQKGRTPSVRELMAALGYKSPRSISKLIEVLIEKEVVQKKPDGSLQLLKIASEEPHRAETVDIPLLGQIACGLPILADENREAMIPVSTKLAKPPHRYFLLRARGDSMNEREIENGDLVLVRQQNTANNGDMVVALIDEEATIKEIHTKGETLILKPRSTNASHQPIILTRDFQIQGVVVTAIPGI